MPDNLSKNNFSDELESDPYLYKYFRFSEKFINLFYILRARLSLEIPLRITDDILESSALTLYHDEELYDRALSLLTRYYISIDSDERMMRELAEAFLEILNEIQANSNR